MYWSEPVFGVGTIDGQDKSCRLTTYRAPTGSFLRRGETVSLDIGTA